jgi:antitoxin YefM
VIGHRRHRGDEALLAAVPDRAPVVARAQTVDLHDELADLSDELLDVAADRLTLPVGGRVLGERALEVLDQGRVADEQPTSRTRTRCGAGWSMIGAMTAMPLEDDPEAGRLAARVERSHERLTLTRDGEPVVVMISAEELAGLEDTVELLRDPDEASAVDNGIAEIAAGRTFDQDDILADLRRRRGEG